MLEETVHSRLSKMCPVKILIRLRECASDLNLRWAHVHVYEGTFYHVSTQMQLKKILNLINTPLFILHYIIYLFSINDVSKNSLLSAKKHHFMQT